MGIQVNRTLFSRAVIILPHQGQATPSSTAQPLSLFGLVDLGGLPTIGLLCKEKDQ